MFQFVVHRLHGLARIPLLPQFFDSLLLLWTAAFHRPRLRAMESLESAVLHLPGTNRCVHRFGGIGFVHAGREFAHLHGNGLLDVHLTRERAAAAVKAGIAEPHHVFGPSAWVSCWLDDPGDLDRALMLIREGMECAECAEA